MILIYKTKESLTTCACIDEVVLSKRPIIPMYKINVIITGWQKFKWHILNDISTRNLSA